MRNKKIFFLITLLLLSLSGISQLKLVSNSALRLPEIKVRRSGPYIGIQRGLYNVFELGGELQYKKVKLVHPDIHGFRLGLNYDFQNNVMGYDAGYWYQSTRVGLTYGALLAYRTNFEKGRMGFAPALGFRLTQFHLQTGFYFLTPSTVFKETNTFFIALKFVMINKRKRNIDK